MVKGVIAAIVIGLVAVIGGIFYFSDSEPVVTVPSFTKPWIEVITPSVFELKSSNESKIKEFHTGDEIAEGTMIGVFDGGVANLHFPDGSVLRIDSDTRLVMEEGNFNPESETLRVKVNLLIGRVWSRIISLTTPESIWEVKTASAVATVRGTAFGMEYDGEAASVVGSENTVAVTVVDPETKEVIEEATVIVEPDKIVEIKKEDVANIKRHLAAGALRPSAAGIASEAGEPILAARAVSREVLEKDWVKRAKAEDAKLNAKLKEVKDRIRDEKEARREIQKTIREDFLEKLEGKQPKAAEVEAVKEVKEVILEPADSVVKPAPALPVSEIRQPAEEKKTEITPTSPSVAAPTGGQAAPTTEIAVPKTFSIKPNRDFSRIVEEEIVSFSAVVETGRITKDVTAEAQWQVVGDIGAMSKPGVFVARLGAAVAEFGESFGSIVATWKDPDTGELFLAKTPIFKVDAKIDLNFEQRG